MIWLLIATLPFIGCVSGNYLDREIDGMTFRCWNDTKCHGYQKDLAVILRNVLTLQILLCLRVKLGDSQRRAVAASHTEIGGPP